VKKQDILENQAKTIFLGIGSNLGNRKKNIEKAKFLLNQNNIEIILISNFYETPSWPDPKKPKFINIVLKIKSFYGPEELLKICKKIEYQLGRREGLKNDPRVCDIDILDFNREVRKIKKQITLPHKSMHLRNFVLFPLYEIQKDWFHPISKKDIKMLISSLPKKDITSIKQI